MFLDWINTMATELKCVSIYYNIDTNWRETIAHRTAMRYCSDQANLLSAKSGKPTSMLW